MRGGGSGFIVEGIQYGHEMKRGTNLSRQRRWVSDPFSLDWSLGPDSDSRHDSESPRQKKREAGTSQRSPVVTEMSSVYTPHSSPPSRHISP